MTHASDNPELSRRGLLMTGGIGALALTPGLAGAQTPARPAPTAPAPQLAVAPPSTITNPPRDFAQPTTYFSDPDVLAIDDSFKALAQPNAAITRLYTGTLWGEGPAWNAQGRYLV